MNIGRWLRKRLFRTSIFTPTDDPEVRELLHRVEELEGVAEEQAQRMSRVEIRVGIRSPARWQRRDAG